MVILSAKEAKVLKNRPNFALGKKKVWAKKKSCNSGSLLLQTM